MKRLPDVRLVSKIWEASIQLPESERVSQLPLYPHKSHFATYTYLYVDVTLRHLESETKTLRLINLFLTKIPIPFLDRLVNQSDFLIDWLTNQISSFTKLEWSEPSICNHSNKVSQTDGSLVSSQTSKTKINFSS